MMQCASCETQITDLAAQTGICPKCGMPLPGGGGTMRFNSDMVRELQSLESLPQALSERGLEENVGDRTVGLVEPESRPAEVPADSSTAAAAPAAPSRVPPTEPKSSDETETDAAPSEVLPSELTEAQVADINRTIESRKLAPDQAHEYAATLLEVSEVSATIAPDALLENNQTSATLPVPGDHESALGIHGDTTLFGPETRLVIQSRELAAPDQNGADKKPGARQDYELVEVIGRGGMGLVYSARQTSVDREVAIKMIWPDHAQDSEARENFLSEAVITGELDHPNIVPIHDVGKDAGNALFYSMKRVRGTPWQDVIGTHSLAENLRILMSVADAVAFAHSRGVVHRDLKPENVMLGGFGEVMVMDWGLAVVTPEFRKSESVARAVSAGCTPSYAAPELVTGPISAIGPHSDVYLLGAILYKVVTGKPPHLARTPQDCCRVAARNQIHPTTETGELVEIARQAMATKPQDRFASVQEFQDAIRSYQSHSESLVLSARAAEDLEQARESKKYEDFARAMFGYQEAVKLWEGNDGARTGLAAARLAYAENALDKQDFDLGLTLVDREDPAQKPVVERLLAGQAERNHRRRRLQLMYRTAIGLVAIIFIGGSIGMYVINQEKETAQNETIEAEKQRKAATKSQAAEIAARKNAVREQELAMQAKGVAETATKAAVASELTAKQQRAQALIEKKRANDARLEAVRSQQAQAFEAYVAQIGLASEQINTNAFDGAQSVLQEQALSPYRGWEWYRLDYLARQGQTASAIFGAEVEAVAVGRTGDRFAAGLRTGQVVIGRWQDLAKQQLAKSLTVDHGAPVLSVSFSADGRWIAVAGESGSLSVWNSSSGERLGPVWRGHAADKPIHHVRLVSITEGRRWLLTASADRTCRLWDISGDPADWKAEAAQVLRGHHLAVRDAAMSPDGRQIVTAGDDGRAVVWELAPDGREFVAGKLTNDGLGKPQRRVFTGHEGAIYALAYSPHGKLVASAGLDKRILLWDPLRAIEDDLTDLVKAADDPLRKKRTSTPFIALEGHTELVHSVAFSPDGLYVLSASDDNTARVWPRAGDTRDVTVLRGHGGWVRSCAFVPHATESGDWNVVTGSHDRQVKLWNVAGYAEVRVLRVDRLTDHGDAVLGAAFNPRGDQIVTASRDHAARIWQVSPGKVVPAVVEASPRKLFEGHDFSVTVAAYLRDGRRVVTSGIDGQVCLWDSENGVQIARLPGTGLAGAVAASPDDAWILTGSSDASIQLWKIDDVIADYTAGRPSAPVHRFVGHEFPVRAIAIAPGGSGDFYSGDDGGAGRIWNLNDRRPSTRVLAHHTQRVNSALFTPDGTRLLTASDDGDVCVCEATSGKLLKKLDHRGDAAAVVALAVTGDGQRAITIGEPAVEKDPFVICDWDLATGQLTRKAKLAEGLTVFGLAVSPLPDYPVALLAIGIRAAGTTELRAWNLATWREEVLPDGRRPLDAQLLSAEHVSVWTAAWSPNARRVLTAGGYEAQVWELDGRKLKMKLGPHRAVAAAGFSADGNYVVTGSWDESLKVWRVEGTATQSLHRVPVAGGGAVNSAVFSPAAESFEILTAHDDGIARLWNWNPLPPGTQPRVAAEFSHPRAVNSARFSHDGARILTLCADGIARVWKTADTRHPELELKGVHTGPILCGAFSQDGHWIATGGEDKLVVIWNAHTGRPHLESPLKGHSAAVNAVAFSHAGDRLVTGSSDNTAKLWDPRTVRFELRSGEDELEPQAADAGPDASASAEIPSASSSEDELRGKELLTLRGHASEVTDVAFSPDDRFVLTAGRDNSAILWLTNKPAQP